MASHPITRYQYKKLIKKTRSENNKFISERDCLMVYFERFCGFRPMESRCIQISHIHLKEKFIFIPAENNKEHQEDYFPLRWRVRHRIKKYLKFMKNYQESIWLFPCYWNKDRNQDLPVDARTFQRSYLRRLKELGFIHLSFYDKQGKPRYNLNHYSLRKRFGTEVYHKFKRPEITAMFLRQHDKRYGSVWNYVFLEQQENLPRMISKI